MTAALVSATGLVVLALALLAAAVVATPAAAAAAVHRSFALLHQGRLRLSNGGVEAVSSTLAAEMKYDAADPMLQQGPVAGTAAVQPGQCGQLEPGVVSEYAYSLTLPGIASAEACCAKCWSVQACQGWSWRQNSGFASGGPECFLKTGGLKEKVNAPGLASGILPSRESLPLAGITANYILNYQGRHSPLREFNCQALQLPTLWAPSGGLTTPIKVLTYNTMWWNVFDRGKASDLHYYRTTNGNGAVTLLSKAARHDLMAFQECMDLGWTLARAGMLEEYGFFDGQEEVCMAYRKSTFTLLAHGQAAVAEDKRSTYWRTRPGQWVRLQHIQTGQGVFFLNHHGPLPVNTGGACGPVATAYNILALITGNAQPGDTVIVVGDFNADARSQTLTHLRQVLYHAVQHGYDNILTNLPPSSLLSQADLGSGGSDHHALSTEIAI